VKITLYWVYSRRSFLRVCIALHWNEYGFWVSWECTIVICQQKKMTVREKYDQAKNDILKRWQNEESVDWRSLTVKGKKAYVKACLEWSGLPTKLIKCSNYVLDGAQVKNEPDLYCLLGEILVGERGYIGQDPEGFYDCFCFSGYGPYEPLVKPHTTITILNKAPLEKGLNKHLQSDKSYFEILIENFTRAGFIVNID
jgi:hypothetical protein